GSINRVLPMLPPGAGVHYLRVEAEALALKEHLHRSRSLIVIGGGLIGLEVVASASPLGIHTPNVGIAPRHPAPRCAQQTSAFVHDYHRARGVDVRVGTAISAVRALSSGRHAIDTKAGDTIEADLIVVGAGVLPDDRLAKAAGLATQDGIVVDDHCRTAD